MNTADDILLLDVEERIALLTLNRPERRNALNAALYRRIPEAVAALDGDPGVDVMIITGADPAFCAGVDLKEFGGEAGAPQASAPQASAPQASPQPAARNAWRGFLPPVTKPVIGAINGPCVTGGLELALACDFLVASERARFGDTHARVGVMPGDGLTVRLPEAVGLRRAKEMSTCGNLIDAPTALEWGLVNHVVSHQELLAFTRGLAAAITGNDQRGVRQMLATYELTAAATAEDAWEIEDRISREWEGSGYDPAEIARRRTSVIDRGHGQLGDR